MSVIKKTAPQYLPGIKVKVKQTGEVLPIWCLDWSRANFRGKLHLADIAWLEHNMHIQPYSFNDIEVVDAETLVQT
jgi:hypothetical protein